MLNDFIQSCSDLADPVLGTDSLVLDGGLTLTGVWSGVSTLVSGADGGPQVEADGSIIFKSDDAVTRQSVMNKKGTAKGSRFMVVSVDIGEAMTTVYLQHATQSLAT